MHNSMWDKRRRIAMDTPTNAQWGQAHAYHLPHDKRSSAIWLPFFNYQTGGDGLITGLGWSGAWRAYFDHQGEGRLDHPGRSRELRFVPASGRDGSFHVERVPLLARGDVLHGQNMFRRLVLEHYSPRIDGKLVEPPISGVVWGGIPSKEHLEIIEKIKEYEIPLDVYWFDAGWYGTGRRPVVFGVRGRLGNHGRRLAAESELAQRNAQAGQRRRARGGNEVPGLGRAVPRHARPADHARASRVFLHRKC
jgi:hypothetical protein